MSNFDYGNYADYGSYSANFGPPSRGGYGGGGGYPPAGGPPPGYGPPMGMGFNSGYQQSPLDAEVATVIHEMRAEINSFEASPDFCEQYRNAKRLLTAEVTRLESCTDPEWLEVDVEKEIKLVKKVLIPSFRYPRFNFVGKVIGPKGVTLQNIAKTFKCHVYVLGRGSSRDKAKEQELLQSGDPQYAHFNGPLHVKIETTAPPALAFKRVAGVLEVLAELLKPVKETYIEGITPMPDSMKKEEDDGDNNDTKKETIEESKIKINEKDYGPELEKPAPAMYNNNPRGGRGGGDRGGGRGRSGDRGSSYGNDRGGMSRGGPMRRQNDFGGYGNGMPPMNSSRGFPPRGGDRGHPGMRGGRGDRGHPGMRGGRGGGGNDRGGPPRFAPY